MYNLLHGALLGGYRGPITVENFWEWANEPAENPQQNFETILLSLVDESNYRTGICGLISPDTMDLGLQTGLYQAPHITAIDRRYELAGDCRTKVVDGMCRADEIYGTKVESEFQRVDLVRSRFPWYFDESVQRADDANYISDDVEPIDDVVVAGARRRLGLHQGDLDAIKAHVVDI